jgi:hypothetical protein
MGIKYDGYVKRPLEEFDYEPWHIKELEKCMENIRCYSF